MKDMRLTPRATRHHGNLVSGDTRCDELPKVFLSQVDAVLFSRSAELHRHFRPHLVAARADRGPNGHSNFFRPRAKPTGHLAQRFCHDAANRAAPPRVHRGDGMVGRIGDQDGNAIGGTNCQDESGLIGDQSVGLAAYSRSIGKDHTVGMDLTNGRRRQRRPANSIAGSESVHKTSNGRQVLGEKH